MAIQIDLRSNDSHDGASPDTGLEILGFRALQHLRCLCRFEDGSVFAYAERGHEFVRASDRELWAVERDDALVSARSGAMLAQRRGRVYFAAEDDRPLYYERAV